MEAGTAESLYLQPGAEGTGTGMRLSKPQKLISATHLLLSFPKQFYQLGSKNSNNELMEVIFIQTTLLCSLALDRFMAISQWKIHLIQIEKFP